MDDKLPTVMGDSGPREALPVVLFSSLGNPISNPLSPKGYVQVALSSSSVQQISPPQGASLALVKIEGAGIRYRDDGVDPSASVGMPLAIGESLIYDAVMNSVKVIGQSDGAICNVAFYGEQA